MLGSWSLFGLGMLMLALFGLFYWLAILVTVRAILAFVGTILVGFSGFIGAVLSWLAHEGTNIANFALGWAFGSNAGAAGGTILTIGAFIVFLHDLHPKKTASKRTGWAGIALAILLLAGVSQIPVLQQIVPGVRNGVTTVKQIGG